MTKSRFFTTFSDEEREKFKQERIHRIKLLTLAYQLGCFVGERIVDDFLLTLSCDELQTRKTISVTCAEGDEYRRLNDIWFKNYKSEDSEDSPEWIALRAHHKLLEDKYIPNILECRFSALNIEDKDMQDFKTGISHSLWNCDRSYYSTNIEDIVVKIDDDYYFTIITLKKA